MMRDHNTTCTCSCTRVVPYCNTTHRTSTTVVQCVAVYCVVCTAIKLYFRTKMIQ